MDELWDDIKSVLGIVAPTIAGVIGTPVAGVAVKLVTDALGLSPDAKPEAIQEAVKGATPEQQLALKQAEQAFVVRMRELDNGAAQIDAADRDSARKRQIEMKDHAPLWIGGSVLFVWALIQMFVVSQGLPPGLSEAVLTRILGMVDTAALGVVFYYFGSSNGGKKPQA